MNIYTQWEKKPLDNLRGVYLQDKESFEKDKPDIIEERKLETGHMDFDLGKKYWKCYVVDLGEKEKGIVLVFDKKQKEADKGTQ